MQGAHLKHHSASLFPILSAVAFLSNYSAILVLTFTLKFFTFIAMIHNAQPDGQESNLRIISFFFLKFRCNHIDTYF